MDNGFMASVVNDPKYISILESWVNKNLTHVKNAVFYLYLWFSLHSESIVNGSKMT